MYSYQTNQLLGEIQRMINQLQQNERNNANTLRSLASQLQNLAATENQATAMLQQIQSLSNQLSTEASRSAQMAYQYSTSAPYDPARANIGSSLPTSSAGSSVTTPYGGGMQGATGQQPPFGQT